MTRNSTRYLIIAILLVAAVPLFCQDAGPAPGILFQLGIGKAFPSYPSQTEAAFSYVESQAGVDRVQVALDLALGVPIGR